MTEIIGEKKDKTVVPCDASREELLFGDGKIRHPMTLGNSLRALKKTFFAKHGRNPRVGFANGKFRYLHPAHCVFLSLCRSRCDLLVVAVNGNYSLRVLNEKSVFEAKERAFAIASVSVVDYVTIFDEENPYLCIQQVDPDVIFKGPDYMDEEVISAGKPVEIIMHPFTENHASDLEEEKTKERKFFNL